MKTRYATIDDVPVISKMYEDFFEYHAGLQPLYYKAAEEHGNYPEYIIKSETDDLIIAEYDGNIAGFVHVLETKTEPYECIVQNKYAVCVDLYTSPEYRRRGVGTSLINAMKEWAINRNLKFIQLNVLAENENAIKFYENGNFQTTAYNMKCPL